MLSYTCKQKVIKNLEVMKMKLTKVDAKVLQSIKKGGNFKNVADI